MKRKRQLKTIEMSFKKLFISIMFLITTIFYYNNDLLGKSLSEHSITLEMTGDSALISTEEGEIDNAGFFIRQVSPFITVERFRSGLHAFPTASYDIVGNVGGAPIPNQNTIVISDTMSVKVTGSHGTTFYKIKLRNIGHENSITDVSFGKIDERHLQLKDLPKNIRIIQLKSGIRVSDFASFKILLQDSIPVPDLSVIGPSMYIQVTGENGDKKKYAIRPGNKTLNLESLSNKSETTEGIKNRIVSLTGKCEIHVTGKENPLEGSLIDLESEDVWLYFDHISPQEVYNKYLAQILVKGSTASIDKNMRLVQYLQGAVIISQSSDYKPLRIFSGENQSGASKDISIYNYYRSLELGEMNNAVRSFKLKKGYMITLAQNDQGTGYSRVYVASDSDLIINKLPFGLYDSISFIRAIPWRWVAKKGWTNGKSAAETLHCSWNYDWNNVDTSSLNVEYVPMRHNKSWNAYDHINIKRNSTHALAFNEPDRPDQSHMTVGEAIAQWPEFLRSGLRLGSPAPSDGGLKWLYSFIDKCDSLNYRVDFVAVHWYKGGQTPQQFYNWLKAIHDRTHRPIWITEWNNGANWTCCLPTYSSQAEAIGKFIQMLDSTSFVERYSLYEWVQATRQMFYKSPVLLTPAGEVYRANSSPMAYNPKQAFSHDYVVLPVNHGGVNSVPKDAEKQKQEAYGNVTRKLLNKVTK
ncbi:MAG TPA: glycosyl hydrolase [Bacteroidales bacterium]